MSDYWRGRRAVVTGAFGFVGTHLCQALHEAGATVTGYGSAIDLRSAHNAATMLKEAGRADMLFHLAAVVGGIGANRARPFAFIHDNLLMNANVVAAAVKARVGKVVGVGSVCGYPCHCPVPFVESNFWNGYPEPTNAPYGIAKRALLTLLTAAQAEHGLSFAYVVPTNLYGEGDCFDLEASHVIPAVIRRTGSAIRRGHKRVRLWGTGKATRDFLHVEDAVRGMLMAAERWDEGMPLNLGSGQEISIMATAYMVGEEMGYTGEYVWDATKPDGQPRRALNIGQARGIGWEPQVALVHGLKRTIDWYWQNAYGDEEEDGA